MSKNKKDIRLGFDINWSEGYDVALILLIVIYTGFDVIMTMTCITVIPILFFISLINFDIAILSMFIFFPISLGVGVWKFRIWTEIIGA